MFNKFITCAIIIVCVSILMFWPKQEGGAISPLAGPVDLLQQPKQLLMDGYRFQNTMFAPAGQDPLSPPTLNVNRHSQRLGVFRDKAYVIDGGISTEGGEGSSAPLIEGYTSPAQASMLQISARGDQDKYLLGEKGETIEDSTRPFGPYVKYGPPERKREINYPNKVFGYGDVINRYHGQISIGWNPPPMIPLPTLENQIPERTCVGAQLP